MRRTRIQVDGLSSAVIEAGPAGTSEAAVFVHGSPGSSNDFLALVEAAGRHGRAVAMDLPGFGRADKPDDWSATPHDYRRHLGRLLQQLGIERAHLVLHDIGGLWGLRWILDHPERAASVALVDAAGMPGGSLHLLATLWRIPVVGEAAMRAVPQPMFDALLRRGPSTRIPQSHLDRMYAEFDTATRRTMLRLFRALDPTAADEMAGPLAALDLPALVVWGEQDSFLPIAAAQRFREPFPSARFVRIVDAGHWPFLSRPGVTDSVIVSWLASQLVD